MHRYKFKVAIKTEHKFTEQQLMAYIRQACGSWGKGMDPDSPFFDISRSNITVKVFKGEKGGEGEGYGG